MALPASGSRAVIATISPGRFLAMRDDATVARFSNASHAAFWADPPTIDRHVEKLTGVYRGMLDRAAQAVPEVRGASKRRMSLATHEMMT